MAYSLRTTERKNYKEIADVQVPRGRRALQKPAKDELYPIEIVERDDEQGKVKVHYLGYGERYDEWKSLEEIVPLPTPIEGRLYYHGLLNPKL